MRRLHRRSRCRRADRGIARRKPDHQQLVRRRATSGRNPQTEALGRTSQEPPLLAVRHGHLHGHQTPAVNVGAGAAPVITHDTLTGLAGSSSYHYRMVATNADGTTYGLCGKACSRGQFDPRLGRLSGRCRFSSRHGQSSAPSKDLSAQARRWPRYEPPHAPSPRARPTERKVRPVRRPALDPEHTNRARGRPGPRPRSNASHELSERGVSSSGTMHLART